MKIPPLPAKALKKKFWAGRPICRWEKRKKEASEIAHDRHQDIPTHWTPVSGHSQGTGAKKREALCASGWLGPVAPPSRKQRKRGRRGRGTDKGVLEGGGTLIHSPPVECT